jgi:hypothetical protein
MTNINGTTDEIKKKDQYTPKNPKEYNGLQAQHG